MKSMDLTGFIVEEKATEIYLSLFEPQIAGDSPRAKWTATLGTSVDEKDLDRLFRSFEQGEEKADRIEKIRMLVENPVVYNADVNRR